MSPEISRRMVVFPDPLAPTITTVSPASTFSEMLCRMRRLSKLSVTSSKLIIALRVGIGMWQTHSLRFFASMHSALPLSTSAPIDKQLGHEKIRHQDQDRRRDHGLGCGPSHAHCPPRRRQPRIAAHHADDKPKDQRLDHPIDEVYGTKGLKRPGPIKKRA